MKAIIFDFDGVIHNTLDIHYRGNQTYFKRKISLENFKDLSNGNVFVAIKSEKFDLEEYTRTIKDEMLNITIDDEIKNELKKLALKYKLFIVSSTSEKLLTQIIKKNNLDSIFECILGGESSKSKVEKFNNIFKKYDLNKNNSIFITDTLGDILEANEVGIKTVAVDFGYHKKERLKKGKPFKIISNFKEINNVLLKS